MPFVAVVVELAPLVERVEEDWEARVRSQTRSFFSMPPVARRDGDGEFGKATARTMWLCWRV